MAASATPLRIILGAACGLLLLGGIAGAAIVDEEGASSFSAGLPEAADTTTTTLGAEGTGALPAPAPADPGAAPTTAAAAPAPAAAPGATTTTRAGRAGGSNTPGGLVAPKPGNYVYEATTRSPTGTRTERDTTVVEPAGTEGDATLQAITIPLDLGGQQALTRNTVAWSAAGAVVRRSVITVTALGQQQLDCVWQPAFPQYAGGLAVGKAWRFQTRCAGKLQGFDVTIEQRASRRVTGTATAAGPAGPVATWTIADDTTVVVTSPLGATSVRSVGSQQLAPALGVPVRADSRVEARTAGSPPQQTTVTSKLVALP